MLAHNVYQHMADITKSFATLHTYSQQRDQVTQLKEVVSSHQCEWDDINNVSDFCCLQKLYFVAVTGLIGGAVMEGRKKIQFLGLLP